MPKDNINNIFDLENPEFLNVNIRNMKVILYYAVVLEKILINNKTKVRKKTVSADFLKLN